jgi:FAD:protein FMN transferase
VASNGQSEFILRKADHYWAVTYAAMASPCEVLVCCKTRSEAEQLASLAYQETRRIEQKFSRYRDDNIIHAINSGNGGKVPFDEETARLLRYAGQCHDLSDGLFDITSGILRKAWTFDGREAEPDENLIKSLLKIVGWSKVELRDSEIKLQTGMELDLGGIGKEYAVDRVADLLFHSSGYSLMVNFGGDIRAIGENTEHHKWIIGIEDPSQDADAVGVIELTEGAVATSGDSRRFCYYHGTRLGHILNPFTGWPVTGAPRSVTVIAENCTETGFLATLAMLHGIDAESFLAAQDVTYHCIR